MTSPVRESCSTRAGKVEVGGGTRASFGPSEACGAGDIAAYVQRRRSVGGLSGAAASLRAAAVPPLPGRATTAACSNASSPSRFSSRSTAGRRVRGRRRDRGRSDSAASSASSRAPWMIRSRRSRTRRGIWRTGVPVTTSAPNSARSTRSTTAPGRDTAAASGLDARKPTMPPAARIGSAPSGGFGMPSAMWARPHAAKVRASVADDEPVGDGVVLRRPQEVARRGRAGRAARRSRPGRGCPATTAWMTSPATPCTPHHSRAATTTARPIRAKPRPSRRCSGSRSRAELPTRRTAPPARCETPIQVPRTARSGSGSPPERARRGTSGGGLARGRATAASGGLA